MKTHTCLNLLIFTILLAACNNQQSEKEGLTEIDLGKAMESLSEISVSQLGERIRYIPLQTTDSSVVGKESVVRLMNNRLIVASHRQPLRMFDKETGRFIRNIGRIGQGPNEYGYGTSVPVFWVDEAAGIIYVKGWEKRIARFDAEGNPLGDYELPEGYGDAKVGEIQSITHDNQMFNYRKSIYTGAPLTLFTCDISSGKVTEIISKESEVTIVPADIQTIEVFKGDFLGIPGSSGCLAIQMKDGRRVIDYMEVPGVWGHKGEVRFKESFNDTIFTVSNGKLRPEMVFNLGKWHCPYDQRFDQEGSEQRIDINYLIEGKQSIYFIFRTNYFQLSKENLYCGVFDKRSGITYTMKSAPLKNDITHLVPVTLLTGSNSGTLVGLCEAADVVEWLDKNPSVGESPEKALLEGVGEEDNPVVVLID